ncbi:MAG TPA: hypothetical protein VIE63_07505, partial [Ramlibacter sp.]
AGVRNSMPAVDAIVLLAGNRPAAIVELAQNIAKAVKGLDRTPAVWLAGVSGEPAAACARLLDQFGIAAHAVPEHVSAYKDLQDLLETVGLRALPQAA